MRDQQQQEREEPLADPVRVRKLLDTGLSAAADPEMDRIADQVRRWLGVPIALVTLPQPDRQVFPGMRGLPEPWATRRATPLSHSFCLHVVHSREPLVVTDARADGRVRDNLAIPDLGVIAYAGMPLTDDEGMVLGTLCAIDTSPRRWSDDDLDLLADLAGHCSNALRLRLVQRDNTVESHRRDAVESAMQGSLARSQSLLLASQAFTRTTTVGDVRDEVSRLVAGDLGSDYVGMFLLDDTGRTVRRLASPSGPRGVEDTGRWSEFPVTTVLPSATAIRENRIVHFPDREAFDAAHPDASRALVREMGLHACIAAPLPGPDGPLGSIVLGWDRPQLFEPGHLLLTTTIAGYAAQALARARRLAHRVNVAYELQQAMLTTLPVVDGLDLGAVYLPADVREHVGGDWYDAIAVHDPAHPRRQTVAVTVGDVIGHTLRAATVMGQVRSMLRQAAVDRPGGPPSTILTAFEDANHTVGLDAAGTTVLLHLHRDPGSAWVMRWTNAGHPPPVLVAPDGRTEILGEHDLLFGFRHTLRAAGVRRRDHECTVEPGSLLVLYTDGLVERRGHDIDEGIDALLALLAEVHTGAPQDIAAALTETLAPHADDDVVVLAVRF